MWHHLIPKITLKLDIQYLTNVFKWNIETVSNEVKLNRIYIIFYDIKQIWNVKYILTNRDKYIV